MSKEAEDRVYYARRALQERARADSSDDASIASVHSRLADEYLRRAQGTEAQLQCCE